MGLLGLKPGASAWKPENKNKARGRTQDWGRGREKREAACPGEDGKLSKTLNLSQGVLKGEERGRARGYYRLCCHGNRNLEADARTTKGGRPPLTASSTLYRPAARRAERYINHTLCSTAITPTQHLSTLSQRPFNRAVDVSPTS